MFHAGALFLMSSQKADAIYGTLQIFSQADPEGQERLTGQSSSIDESFEPLRRFDIQNFEEHVQYDFLSGYRFRSSANIYGTHSCLERRYSKGVDDRPDCHHVVHAEIHQTFKYHFRNKRKMVATTHHSKSVTSTELPSHILSYGRRGPSLYHRRPSQLRRRSVNTKHLSLSFMITMGLKRMSTSKSVPTRKYALLRGESMTYNKAVARTGPISIGPSPRACRRNLIPPVLATKSISIKTVGGDSVKVEERKIHAYVFPPEFLCK